MFYLDPRKSQLLILISVMTHNRFILNRNKKPDR